MDLSRNRGGITGGDRAETGDLEARPTQGADPEDLERRNDENDLEDLTIHTAADPDLGLTDIGDIPPEDWAADTGPSRSGEESSHAVDRELMDADRSPSGRKIDLTPTARRTP
jgi:hypothetical protein